MQLKDFKPIDLIMSIYKILAKVLSPDWKRFYHELSPSPKELLSTGDRFLDQMLVANGRVYSQYKAKKPEVTGNFSLEKP